MFKKVASQVSFPQIEEKVLAYWDEHKIFEKSVTNREGAKRYSFYDGPPFATGTPHYGHMVASAIKDTVPRYFTMKGFQVERKWGWDCHGLPIENIAEKELGITRKKDIEALGVEKFNDMCRSKVFEYVMDWKKVIWRFGRWADMEHPYQTMDLAYMESIWWVFKSLWDKGLIYESYRTMHICPRCETTLSQSEVAEGYKDVKDFSAVVRFELVDEPGTFVLAWTTTPWTLPGNTALAVGKDIEYVKVRQCAEISVNDISQLERGTMPSTTENFLIVSKTFFEEKLDNSEWCQRMNLDFSFEKISSMRGIDLIDKSYKSLFDYYSQDEKLEHRENGWKIYAGDFVTTEEGTGVVHIATAFGEDDMELGKKEHLPFVQHVKMDGTMKDEVTDFAGMSVKPLENPQATDVEIIKYLAHHRLLFSKEKYEHSYPHCWRCDTPLLNYATSSWFVNVTKIKDRALALAENIHWSPGHIKEGRFGKWLASARDWSISRQRYWASVMPIWKCVCGEMRVFGSVSELEQVSGKIVTDLHKHIVDEIVFPCEKCGENMKRIPDVLDTWFDSGSMPYAQAHYPFENVETFEASFPADFIAEGVDQTRAWFYYQHILATALKDSHAFQNVIVNGIVVGEDGKKLSKKLKNYADPMEIIEKYGADVLRFSLLSSPVVSAENLTFTEGDLADVTRNTFRMLWNSYSFFTMYAVIDNWQPKKEVQVSKNILDKWMLSELQLLIREVDRAMGQYELSKATRAFMPFIDHLSNWYIRRSRKRFWKSEDDSDKENAYQTLYFVLVTLTKMMAPFTPFLAEEIYRNLTGEESVHLADWPEPEETLLDEKLNEEMLELRSAVSVGLQVRANEQRKVRQPLSKLVSEKKFDKEFEEILKEELNVKEVVYVEDISKDYAGLPSGVSFHQKIIAIDIEITPELKLEGEAREIIRAIQEGRKKADFNVEDRIVLGYQGKEAVFRNEELSEMIQKEVLATASPVPGKIADAEYTDTVIFEGEAFTFFLKKI
ncbi:MAG: isoleucine--tRNA ligase [Minisyncoccota bacterium]